MTDNLKKHSIDLKSFLSKGNVFTDYKNEMLYMTTTHTIPEGFDKEHLKIHTYLYLPDKYKLPLRIDITLKTDSPGLYILLGNGHINFGTLWSDNRRIDDIAEPNYKPKSFDNHIPMNEFVSISLIYGLSEMQILVNSEERYYSKKEKYFKSELFKQLNMEGFFFKITCSKRTNLCIKSVQITEYADNTGMVHFANKPAAANNTNSNAVENPTIETCIAFLPDDIKNEIMQTDEYLRKLKPMKFKRQIEKHGNKITYVASDYGLSYAVYPSGDIMTHSLQWYIITGSKPENWHRKADMMEATLNRLYETSPEFAQRMFDNLKECVGCCVNGCAVKTLYKLAGKKKLSCHGKMVFKMAPGDFQDVRNFMGVVNELINENNP